MERATLHPSESKLRDFNAGALTEPALAEVSMHLDLCPDCCNRLSAVAASGDALSWLRDLAAQPADATQAYGVSPSASEDEDNALRFLQPSARPGSLGRLGSYEVLQVLGRGEFGVVFRAFDETLQRVVAVKMMSPHLAATSPARKRFLREARSSAGIRHENVVQVYEVEEQPLPYLVMEFIPGETLQQRLNRTGPVDVHEVLRVGRQIAAGLAAAHANDLIHRDIKPANLLIEGGQRVKITDFGLARAADDASMTQSGFIAGTPMYMAPEQALGHNLDARADLFSLGSVLYQMVSGRPPFRAPSTMAVLKRVAEESPRPIQEIIPETPAWLSDIIAKLHAKDPADRYQSAREVADVLADCETQLKAHGKVRNSSRTPAAKPQRQGRWKWAAAAMLLAPLMAFGVFALTRGTVPSKPGDKGKTEPPVPIALVKNPDPKPVPEEQKAPTPTMDPDRHAAQFVLSMGGAVQVNDQAEFIDAVGKLPQGSLRLTTVHLIANAAQVSDAGLAHFKGCKNLQVVMLIGARQVTDEGLAHFEDCKNLIDIRLAHTKVTDAGLARFKDCKNLMGLGLENTNVTDAGLAYFKDCTNLRDLRLDGTRVQDAGLASFKDCKELTFLLLSNTQVSDAGLAHIKACTNLRVGELCNTKVGDDGLACFRDCANLTELDLRGTKASLPGLVRLKDLKSLTQLKLCASQFPAQGIEELKKALPGCRIVLE